MLYDWVALCCEVEFHPLTVVDPYLMRLQVQLAVRGLIHEACSAHTSNIYLGVADLLDV